MASQAPQTVRGPKLSPLSYLTTQSARFGVWEVAIFNPTARTREYIWNQEKRTSYSFQCMLVSTADPTQYVLGDSHGKGMNAVKLNGLKNKFMLVPQLFIRALCRHNFPLVLLSVLAG